MCKINRSDFERFMSVPEKHETKGLDRRVINPSIDELNENSLKNLFLKRKSQMGLRKTLLVTLLNLCLMSVLAIS
ncbi:hypothetical protein [Campylobacter anatolicus]|uniref:hypothetical protein n=1 Tax=Campylobacter anatolicus TaxID=2829105 RepID=UPI001E3EB128|nr:hypothetical protein [Campylobacter anatolicus]